MFLVKCVSDDRKKAVFVKADGLTALITETKLKLKLADGDYEVSHYKYFNLKSRPSVSCLCSCCS